MVGLVPQRSAVLGGVVVGLWHVYDCFVIQGYCISIEGPVSAVYLVCKAKIQCAHGGVNFDSSLKAKVQIYATKPVYKSLKNPPLFNRDLGENVLSFNKLIILNPKGGCKILL